MAVDAVGRLFPSQSQHPQTETDLEAGDCAVCVTVLVVDVHHHVVVVSVVQIFLFFLKQL